MSGFWRSWLQIWCWMTLAVGAMFAAGAIPAADVGVRLFYDVVAWPLDGASPYGEEVRFTAALLGAVMIGWVIALFGLIGSAEAIGAPAWRMVTASVVVWYAIDSAISVASGWPVNALSNTGFLVTFLIPIVASGVLGEADARRLSEPR